MSLPIGIVGRQTSILRYVLSHNVLCRPAATANRVLPVPALPMIVTILIRSSSIASTAKYCSLFRGWTIRISSGVWMSATNCDSSASKRASAECDGSVSSFNRMYSFGFFWMPDAGSLPFSRNSLS